jgi:hypothetical protein
MGSKFFKTCIVALALILTSGVIVALHSDNAIASNQSAAVNASASSKHHPATNVRGNKRQGRFNGINVVSETASVLKVKPIWIMEEMKKGKTLSQISKEKGLTEQAFLQKLIALETKIINAASKSGQIPEKQALVLLSGMSERLTKALQLTSVNVNDHNGGMSM